MKKLEKLKEKGQQNKNSQSTSISNEDAIMKELRKSKGLPLVSWEEKFDHIR